MSNDDSIFKLPTSGRAVDELLKAAREARDAGVISEQKCTHIEQKVAEACAHFLKVMGQASDYIDKAREDHEREQKRKEEEQRRQREEEAQRQREEEERRQREIDERRRREEAERIRREEELKRLEKPMTISELESLDWRIKTLDLATGAMSMINMYWEALEHGDWVSMAESIFREKELAHQGLKLLEVTWTQLLREDGLLVPMANICPRDEENPLVVPGFLYCTLPCSEDHIFCLVNKENRRKFRYTPGSIVRIQDLGGAKMFTPFDESDPYS